MRVLVVGGGGREHALVWALSKSTGVRELLCAPGNAGIARLATCYEVKAEDVPGIVSLAREKRVDLVVVGPEQPLVDGLADALAEHGLAVFGPKRAAARLEGSKQFAKQVLMEAGVPTARFVACDTPEQARAAIARFEAEGCPVVVKADGLAAGKGVTVTSSAEEALAAVEQAMVRRVFGESGSRVVIEERLEGEEASVLALVDGTTFRCLAASQDHKRVGDGDVGPNTGGMGAYAPAPVVTGPVQARIEEQVLAPVVRTMAERGTPYKGVLYAGLMIRQGHPYVIEFNVRFGDPETQVVLPLLEDDLLELLLAVCEGKLEQHQIRTRAAAATCVVMASQGYPGSYERDKPIIGLDAAEALDDVMVFHAGTKNRDGRVVTSGGRVVGVTAVGRDIRASIARAYEAVACISYEGAIYRRDIGHRALAREP